jgi:hypothetical protein
MLTPQGSFLAAQLQHPQLYKHPLAFYTCRFPRRKLTTSLIGVISYPVIIYDHAGHHREGHQGQRGLEKDHAALESR